MRNTLAALSATLVLAGLAAPPVWAQSGGHMMMMPDEMKWADIPSLPPGAKISVLEARSTRQSR